MYMYVYIMVCIWGRVGAEVPTKKIWVMAGIDRYIIDFTYSHTICEKRSLHEDPKFITFRYPDYRLIRHVLVSDN